MYKYIIIIMSKLKNGSMSKTFWKQRREILIVRGNNYFLVIFV